MKLANKLHCQLGHTSPENLKKLIKASNINDQELLDIIDLVDQNCQVCLKYEKSKLRPAVHFLLSKGFDVVAADLKSINRIQILHMIDNARGTAVVKSQKREEIVDAFIKQWTATFGDPDTILSDNRESLIMTCFVC